MRRKATRKSGNLRRPKTKLGLPDLDHSKSAVLNSLRSPESKRGYRHAIDEFIQWYCSEPRLSFNKVVVTRFRVYLEDRRLASGTINGRLAAVRRLAYEAADAGLLSPELAAKTKASQELLSKAAAATLCWRESRPTSACVRECMFGSEWIGMLCIPQVRCSCRCAVISVSV